MRLAAFALAAALANGAAYLDPKGGDGCWVHFFEERDFGRSMGRLAGTLYINSVIGPGLIGTLEVKEYLRRADSLLVGPEARLIAYAQPGFREVLTSLEPGAQAPDLDALGFPGRVGSLKIACVRG
jgi:hypothetical protein